MKNRKMKQSFPILNFKLRNLGLAMYIVLDMLFSVVIAVSIGKILDIITMENVDDKILCLISIVLFSALALFVISVCAQYFPMKILLNESMLSCQKTIEFLLHMPMKEYIKHEKGYYINLVTTSAFSYGDIYAQINILLIGNMICVGLLLIIALCINIWLGILFVVYIPIYYCLMRYPSKKVAEYQDRGLPTQDAFLSATKNVVEGKREINIARADSFYKQHFFQDSNKYLKFIQKFRFYEIIIKSFPDSLSKLFQIISLIITIGLFTSNRIEIGAIFVIYQISSLLQSPLDNCIGILSNYVINKVHIERLNKFAMDSSKITEFEKLYRKSDNLAEIFNGKFYATAKKEFLLFEIDKLMIPKKSLIILKGSNGSGKSMFINFLTGFSDAESFLGKIVMDESLKEAAYLSYPILIINGRIEDNIWGGDLNNEICNMLNIDFIDKNINNNPVNLSYGEQQKLNLLRIFLSKKDVFILDEPFTNLDHDTIENLIQYIVSLKNKKSIIIIMHSSDFDEYADVILEIKDNKLFQVK